MEPQQRITIYDANEAKMLALLNSTKEFDYLKFSLDAIRDSAAKGGMSVILSPGAINLYAENELNRRGFKIRKDSYSRIIINWD